jgi:hypothetical protein
MHRNPMETKCSGQGQSPRIFNRLRDFRGFVPGSFRDANILPVIFRKHFFERILAFGGALANAAVGVIVGRAFFLVIHAEI